MDIFHFKAKKAQSKTLDSHEIPVFPLFLLLVSSSHVTKPWVHLFHQSHPKDCVAPGNGLMSAQLLLDIRESLSANCPNLGRNFCQLLHVIRHGRDTNPGWIWLYFFHHLQLGSFSQVWTNWWQTGRETWGRNGKDRMRDHVRLRERDIARQVMNLWEKKKKGTPAKK